MEYSAPIKQAYSSNVSKWLFNPFHFIAGGKALALGLLAILVTGLLAYTGYVRFDGILYFTLVGHRRYPIWLYIVESSVPWVLLSVILMGCGRIISSSRFRIIDIFGTQALARWPLAIVGLFLQQEAIRNSHKTILVKLIGGDVSFLEVAASVGLKLVFLLLGIWVLALMYRGFSVSCNVKGTKAVIAFVVSFLATEYIWKMVMLYLVV